MPDDVSMERVSILRAYGAQVILTHRLEFMQGAINKAKEILADIRLFYAATVREPGNPRFIGRRPLKKYCRLLVLTWTRWSLVSVRVAPLRAQARPSNNRSST